MHILKKILQNRKTGRLQGVYSACTASPAVIDTVFRKAAETDTPAVIEATANQVNQFGGYTGMRPADYFRFICETAEKIDFDIKNLIAGGDHLGPLVWKDEEAESAMEKAEALVKEYVEAGFTKIHIDTSMMLGGDDRTKRLSDEIIAERAARLVRACESVRKKELVYIIGSEVPIPGGVQEEEEMCVTSQKDVAATLDTFTRTFEKYGIGSAMEDVVAIVVQPGVEFGDSMVTAYDPDKAKDLVSFLDGKKIVFEGHSTDYQTKENLRNMVSDGIAILKVGPALTFYYREALFALSEMEKELSDSPSMFRELLESKMLLEPKNWKKYYSGTEKEVREKRAFSYSDRSRYYMSDPDLVRAIERMIANLSAKEIPLSMLSQYMPMQYAEVVHGKCRPVPEELIRSRIGNVIDDYLFATIK